MLKQIAHLQINPEKGRRKDLKKIDSLIGDLQSTDRPVVIFRLRRLKLSAMRYAVFDLGQQFDQVRDGRDPRVGRSHPARGKHRHPAGRESDRYVRG